MPALRATPAPGPGALARRIGRLVVLLCAFGVAASRADAGSGHLFVYHIDVGQGDATLVVSPEGRTLLVDAGNNGMGASRVLPLLRTLGIGALDYVVATHYDADHIGGLDEVVRATGGVRVAAYDRGERNLETTTKTYADYVDALGARRATIAPGSTAIDLGAGTTVRCMAVNGEVEGGGAVPLGRDSENEASVALLVRFGRFDYFLGGDLAGGGLAGSNATADVESAVAPRVGDVDVLRVGHHGSQTSSNAFFLATLRPEIAVVSVGNGGSNRSRYRHPSRATLDRFLTLEGLRAVFQTRVGETRGGLTAEDLKLVSVEDRDVVLVTDGESYLVNGVAFPVDERGAGR